MRDSHRFVDRPPAALSVRGSLRTELQRDSRRKPAVRRSPGASRQADAAAAGPGPSPPPRLLVPAGDIVTWDEDGGVAVTREEPATAPGAVAPPALEPATAPPPAPPQPAPREQPGAPDRQAPQARASSIDHGQLYIDGGTHRVRPLGDLVSDAEVARAVEAIRNPRARRDNGQQAVLDGFLDQLRTSGAARPLQGPAPEPVSDLGAAPLPAAPASLPPAPSSARQPVAAERPQPADLRMAAVAGVASLSDPVATAPAPAQAGGTVLDLGASVGRGGTNRPEDVAALKRRLIGLGFSWLTTDDHMDDATIETIQLFQAIKNGHASVKGHAANDGLVEVDKATHRWLQATNAPRWQLMPTGSDAEGFANSELADTTSQYDFGTDWLAGVVSAAGLAYRASYRDSHPGATLLTVNDASLPRGIPQPGERVQHKGHQTGLEIDLRLPRTDGAAGGVTHADGLYDREAMRAQLRALRSQLLVTTVLFNDDVLVGEGLCTSFDDHDDHVHVRIKPPVAGPAESAGPTAQQTWYPARTASFDVNVEGEVPAIGQPSAMTCWATVATMMLSWRDRTSYTIQAAMDRAGATYRNKFDNDQGLLGSEKGAFLAALGLRAEPPMSYSVEGMLQLLKTHGPIWVTTDEDPSALFAIHARIITGMVGDGTPNGTLLRVTDPAGGARYTEPFSTFVAKYESVARGDLTQGGQFRVQVVHF